MLYVSSLELFNFLTNVFEVWHEYCVIERHFSAIIFDFLHLVIIWQMCKFVRWKQHKCHLHLGPEMLCGNTLWENILLLLG